mmetsp:Transcript_24851/g.57615  ORF Transcript_24851/g.57615 Transcript_24851/m.57615 type:complete len:230 (-) Transcript_24851:435-1124(-)
MQPPPLPHVHPLRLRRPRPPQILRLPGVRLEEAPRILAHDELQRAEGQEGVHEREDAGGRGREADHERWVQRNHAVWTLHTLLHRTQRHHERQVGPRRVPHADDLLGRRPANVAVGECPAVGVEALISSHWEGVLRCERVVDRDDGRVDGARPIAQVYLVGGTRLRDEAPPVKVDNQRFARCRGCPPLERHAGAALSCQLVALEHPVGEEAHVDALGGRVARRYIAVVV